MLNRKDNKSNGSGGHSNKRSREVANKNKPLRRRFIISPKAPARLDGAKTEPQKAPPAATGKGAPAGKAAQVGKGLPTGKDLKPGKAP